MCWAGIDAYQYSLERHIEAIAKSKLTLRVPWGMHMCSIWSRALGRRLKQIRSMGVKWASLAHLETAGATALKLECVCITCTRKEQQCNSELSYFTRPQYNSLNSPRNLVSIVQVMSSSVPVTASKRKRGSGIQRVAMRSFINMIEWELLFSLFSVSGIFRRILWDRFECSLSRNYKCTCYLYKYAVHKIRSVLQKAH